mmetsp:Transcript_19297/g.23735  ORF Transcript_19297/g.23735 Transcript_19297/m.23735 type:complete len:346 (-) Transcript_19297:1157-2194(-)
MSFTIRIKLCGLCGVYIKDKKENRFSKACSVCHHFFQLHPACAVKLVHKLKRQGHVQTRPNNKNLTPLEFNSYNVSLHCHKCRTESCFQCGSAHGPGTNNRSVICSFCRNTCCYMLPYSPSGTSSKSTGCATVLSHTAMCNTCKQKEEVIPPQILIKRYNTTTNGNSKISERFAESMLDSHQQKAICKIINETFGIKNGGKLNPDFNTTKEAKNHINMLFSFNNNQQFDIFNSKFPHNSDHRSYRNKWGIEMHLHSLKRLGKEKEWLNDEVIDFIMKCFNKVEQNKTISNAVPGVCFGSTLDMDTLVPSKKKYPILHTVNKDDNYFHQIFLYFFLLVNVSFRNLH